MEVVAGNNTFAADTDNLLPDGLENDPNLLAEKNEELPDASADGQMNDEAYLKSLLTGANAENADTTTAEQNAEEPHAEEETAETAEPSAEAEQPKSRILKLKVNHKEQDFDVNSVSDDELTALLQKGKAFDALKESENKRAYRAAYEEQIENGMPDAVAKLVAQSVANGNSYSLEDKDETHEEETPVESEEFKQLRSQLDDLRKHLNEMTENNTKTVANLQKENKILKQNAAAVSKSPVKPVSGNGSVQPNAENPWLKGFDMDTW